MQIFKVTNPPAKPPQNFSDPFISEKKIVRIIGFMVFKMTGSDSRFQRKNRFWKICTESRDIGQNVSNFAGLVWKAVFGHVFANISGLGAYFSNPIFELKPWVRAGHFEYHEPYNLNNFFFVCTSNCTQNDRLDLTVSTQKSVLKTNHPVPRYLPKCFLTRRAKPNLQQIMVFLKYLSPGWVVFQTDFCVETVRLRRSFWVQ